jgi:hypothetical protein
VHRQNTIKVSRFFSAEKKDYVKEMENGHLLFFQKCPKSKSQGVSQKYIDYGLFRNSYNFFLYNLERSLIGRHLYYFIDFFPT